MSQDQMGEDPTAYFERAYQDYEQWAAEQRTEPPEFTQATRRSALGAAGAAAGLADNGGLMGGLVENDWHGSPDLIFTHDAVAAFRFLGFDDAATLIETAADAYPRMRPGGFEELSAADEQWWEQLDEQWFALEITERLDQLAQ
ncbi:MAG: hypothetical protein Q4G34_07560 [Micrococcus sp.]|nr:hypothetical protein [Micrococcus sp.]